MAHGHGTDWARARDISHDLGSAHGINAVALSPRESAGRVLAEDVYSRASLPPTSVSAMDGWVVAGDAPWRLGGTIAMGAEPHNDDLRPGTAFAITTGGSVPPGAHGVLRSENGDLVTDAQGETWVTRGSSAGEHEPALSQHVRGAGEEAKAGELLIRAGETMTPPRISLAAVSGVDSVFVRRVPTVALFVSGDEVLTEGIPRPGQVRDAYSPSLPSLASAFGARVVSTTNLSDDYDATVAALRATDADLVITTGGSSHGDSDHIRRALAEAGATVAVDGVRMRPGHPVIIGSLSGNRPLLCVPGNPLAAFTCMMSFLVPMIDGLNGRPVRALPTIDIAEVSWSDSQHRSAAVFPFTWEGNRAVSTTWQGSAMLRGLAHADGLIALDAPDASGSRGSVARVIQFPWAV